MKTKRITVLAFSSLLLGLFDADAAIVYNFARNDGPLNQTGEDLDDLSSGTSTVGGVTLSASANDGEFNQTGTTSFNFGINASGGGDSTDGFDNGSGVAESMTFSFSVGGTLDSMDFDRVGTGDTFDLIFDGGSTFSFSENELESFDVALIAESFSAGQDITLLWTGGGDFGLESITVTAVPEPEEYALIAGLALGGFALYRRRRRMVTAAPEV